MDEEVASTPQGVEDVRACLKFSEVNVEAVKKKARRDSMLSILESIMI